MSPAPPQYLSGCNMWDRPAAEIYARRMTFGSLNARDVAFYERQQGCHVVASNDVERCAAKIIAKVARRHLHAWLTGCFGAESKRRSGDRSLQRRGLGSIEGGVGIRAGT